MQSVHWSKRGLRVFYKEETQTSRFTQCWVISTLCKAQFVYGFCGRKKNCALYVIICN